MPGPIIHLIVQRNLASAVTRQKGGRLGEILRKDPCSPYTGFGAMGPDFLFFSTREYGDAIGDLVNFVFDAYDAVEPIIKFLEDVKETVDDVISFLLPDEIEALLNDISATGSLLGNTLLTSIAAVTVDNVDLFFPFYPKIQSGAKEKDWYWFDFLHYRRTGEFCSHMWKQAEALDDDDLRRYVMGYASHIGTDVVGHPYVNAITGGPYRTHWHRHKVVENWMDAWARRHYGPVAGEKNCIKAPEDGKYLTHSVPGSYYSQLCEFPDKKLPEKLGKMFITAMKDVYEDVPHPPNFSFDDLDDTYRLWIRWFERATSIGDTLPPDPVPPPGAASIDLLTSFADAVADVWDGFGGGGGGGGGFSIWGIFAAIFDFIKRLIETLVTIVTWTVTHLHEILTLPVTEAIAFLRWIFYQLRMALWQIYDEARFALVLGGYFFPAERDLDKTPWGEAFVNSANVQMTGGPMATYFQYPRRRQLYQLVGATELCLIYPNRPMETPNMEPCPWGAFGQYPNVMISGLGGFTPIAEEFFDAKQPMESPYTGSLDFTVGVQNASYTTPQFGNAIQFSAKLIVGHLDKLPNLNLDGDRGYGFKTWRLKGLDPNADPGATPMIEQMPLQPEYGPTV